MMMMMMMMIFKLKYEHVKCEVVGWAQQLVVERVDGGATCRNPDGPQTQPRLQHRLRERSVLLLRVPRPARHPDSAQRRPHTRTVSGQTPATRATSAGERDRPGAGRTQPHSGN